MSDLNIDVKFRQKYVLTKEQVSKSKDLKVAMYKQAILCTKIKGRQKLSTKKAVVVERKPALPCKPVLIEKPVRTSSNPKIDSVVDVDLLAQKIVDKLNQSDFLHNLSFKERLSEFSREFESTKFVEKPGVREERKTTEFFIPTLDIKPLEASITTEELEADTDSIVGSLDSLKHLRGERKNEQSSNRSANLEDCK